MSWRPLKHYCDGPPEYGLNVSSDAYVDDGFRLLRTTDIDDDGALSPDSEGVFVGRHLIGPRHVLRPGDLLFSRAGSLGRCFRVPQEARDLTFAGYLVRFRPLPSFEPRYIEYCASAAFAQASIRADAVTSTISNFNAERYGNLLLPDSDPEQQRTTADYLDRETARIDALIEKKRRMIQLLEERRMSVMVNGVTGRYTSGRLSPARALGSCTAARPGVTPSCRSLLVLAAATPQAVTTPTGGMTAKSPGSPPGRSLSSGPTASRTCTRPARRSANWASPTRPQRYTRRALSSSVERRQPGTRRLWVRIWRRVRTLQRGPAARSSALGSYSSALGRCAKTSWAGWRWAQPTRPSTCLTSKRFGCRFQQ